MVITKKLISTGCAAMIAASMCAPAMAFADPGDDPTNTTAKTTMSIQVKASNVNIDVPAVVDPDDPNPPSDEEKASLEARATTWIFADQDVIPNLPIRNNGNAAVTLYSMDLDTTPYTNAIFGSAWTFDSYGEDYTNVVDQKSFGVKATIGGASANATVKNNGAEATVDFGDGVQFNKDEKKEINWDVTHSNFSKAQTTKEAFDLTLNFTK